MFTKLRIFDPAKPPLTEDTKEPTNNPRAFDLRITLPSYGRLEPQSRKDIFDSKIHTPDNSGKFSDKSNALILQLNDKTILVTLEIYKENTFLYGIFKKINLLETHQFSFDIDGNPLFDESNAEALILEKHQALLKIDEALIKLRRGELA